MSVLEFEGSNCLRQRLVLSILTGKPIRIRNIRSKDMDCGLNASEKNLLQLIEKVTNGSSIYIQQRGTQIDFKPGILYGGDIEHDCGQHRSIAYYLEVLLMLSPFCKHPIDAILTGITNDRIDPSVDALKQSSLPLMKRFFGAADDEELQIQVQSRGLPPEGGGKVIYKCPIRRTLRPIQCLETGKVKRIRGVAFATRVSPQIANRMVTEAKGILLKYIPDIYIYTDHLKGAKSGKSRGFGLSLWAETTNGIFYTGDAVSHPFGSGKETEAVAEDIAKEATHSLLNDIFRGGAVDTLNQGLASLFMAFGQRDLSKVEFGPLSPFSIQMLRHLKTFVELTFKLDIKRTDRDNEEDEEEYKKGSKKVIAACIGIGFTNLSKTVS